MTGPVTSTGSSSSLRNIEGAVKRKGGGLMVELRSVNSKRMNFITASRSEVITKCSYLPRVRGGWVRAVHRSQL